MVQSETGNNSEFDFDEVIQGLGRIAFGSSADAIKLLLHADSMSDRQIKKLDTFNIASLKRTGSGISEIKFFDRLKAMESLARLTSARSGGENGFLEALAKSAGLLDGGDEDDDGDGEE